MSIQFDEPRWCIAVLVPDNRAFIRLLEYQWLAANLARLPSRNCEMWDLTQDEWQRGRLDDIIPVNPIDGHAVLIRMIGIGRCIGLEDALWFAHAEPL